MFKNIIEINSLIKLIAVMKRLIGLGIGGFCLCTCTKDFN